MRKSTGPKTEHYGTHVILHPN